MMSPPLEPIESSYDPNHSRVSDYNSELMKLSGGDSTTDYHDPGDKLSEPYRLVDLPSPYNLQQRKQGDDFLMRQAADIDDPYEPEEVSIPTQQSDVMVKVENSKRSKQRISK